MLQLYAVTGTAPNHLTSRAHRTRTHGQTIKYRGARAGGLTESQRTG